MSLARIGRLVLATGTVTAVVAAGIGTPAHADWWKWKATQGSNYAGVGSDKYFIGACDLERDGNGVYAEYQYIASAEVTTSRVGDGDGSAGGCGTTTSEIEIIRFRVCEDDWGSDSCSAWCDTNPGGKCSPFE